MASRSIIHQLKGKRRYRSLSILSESKEVQATRKWFESIVVEQKLCPFAAPLLDSSKLRIVSTASSTRKESIDTVRKEVSFLMSPPPDPTSHPETTLIVWEEQLWPDFREFVRLSWDLQEECIGEKYQSTLQLVLFHPMATHQTYGESLDEEERAGDFTIRSPCPTVHLLREQDVL